LVDGALADDGKYMGLEARQPLATMLGVTPRPRVLGVYLPCRLCERWNSRRGAASAGDRIFAISDKSTILVASVPSLREGDIADTP
jgi:hypothetical protein